MPVATGRQVARALTVAARNDWRRLALAVGLMLASALVALVFPLVIGTFVDAAVARVTNPEAPIPWWQLIALAFSAVATGVVTAWGTRMVAAVTESMVADFRERFVAAALTLRRRDVEAAGRGDHVTRASDDVAKISEVLPGVIPGLGVSAFTLVVVAGGIGFLDWRYLLVLVVLVPWYIATVRWYLRAAPSVYAHECESRSVRGAEVLGTLLHLPAVAAHRRESHHMMRMRSAGWQSVRWAMRARIVQNRLWGRLNASSAAGLVIVMAIGVWLAAIGEASAGSVTAAALLFLRFVAPVLAMLEEVDSFQEAMAALARLIGVIDQSTPESDRPVVPGPAVVTAHQIEFGYTAARPVVTGIDLQVREDEVIAIVGTTGSGKSTLAALVAGVHEPDSGVIMRSVRPEEIAMVTQETHVFGGTLRENLTLVHPAASDADVTSALRAVGAEGIVARLPEGLDTRVGHGTTVLPAADVQHLALARVMLAPPRLIILDEATADADSSDTGRLDEATREVLRGRAAIVIAHRLSQVLFADRVIVMHEGRMVEHGTHDELLAAAGRYAKLWSAWQRGRGQT